MAIAACALALVCCVLCAAVAPARSSPPIQPAALQLALPPGDGSCAAAASSGLPLPIFLLDLAVAVLTTDFAGGPLTYYEYTQPIDPNAEWRQPNAVNPARHRYAAIAPSSSMRAANQWPRSQLSC